MKAVLWLAVSSEAQVGDDKISLSAQESALRAMVAQRGDHIIDVLTVPGFSRRFTSWDAFTTGAAREKITAPAQMSTHWARRDFDVVYVYDGSRFGRSQALFAYFVEETIAAGAILVLSHDGEINQNNYRMFISMSGYSAASDIDRFVARSKQGKRALAERGVNLAGLTTFTHLVIRNDRGKRERLVVDESKRRLFSDFVTVLCGDDVRPPAPWQLVEKELFERFGHGQPDGTPYRSGRMYQMIRTPLTWGHTAYGFRPYANLANRWLWDENVPTPEDVTLFRDRVPAVYIGEERERLVAELNRRTVLRGRARAANTFLFSHLIMCAECGRLMVYHRGRQITAHSDYYLCAWSYNTHSFPYTETRCTNRKMLREDVAIEYLDTLLRALLDGSAPDLFKPQVNVHDHIARVVDIEREMNRVETVLGGLMLQRASTPLAAQATLERMIVQQSELLAAQRRALDDAQRVKVLVEQQYGQRDPAIDQLREMTLRTFWEMDHTDQNQLLHRLMGDWRIESLAGEVIGLIDTRQE